MPQDRHIDATQPNRGHGLHTLRAAARYAATKKWILEGSFPTADDEPASNWAQRSALVGAQSG
eukprot:2023413-Prorocentrum_lima.AAC.1